MKPGWSRFGMTEYIGSRTHPYRGVGPTGPATIWVHKQGAVMGATFSV